MVTTEGDAAADEEGPEPGSTRIGRAADGRRARRDRNRLRVLDAVVELFSEDQLVPTARAVAERSGVSLRSIYRYFDDQDDLLRAAIEHHFERMEPLATVDGLGEGSLPQRIEQLVAARLRLYRAVAPTARAARASASSHDLIGREVARVRHALLRQIERHFSRELDRLDPDEARAVLSTVDALCQHGAIDHLDVQRGLPPEEIHDVLARALRRLLSPRRP